MPTYEYTCKNCGESIEVLQKFSDKPLKLHDVCGGELKKVFHARGVVFKGGGFYATDSRSASSTARDSNGGQRKSESKATSEPSAKPESKAKSD